MAAVDRIYATEAQRDELRAWLAEHNPEIHMYPDDVIAPCDPSYERAISSFSTEEDVWLWENCDLQWVKDAIEYQYNGAPPHWDFKL